MSGLQHLKVPPEQMTGRARAYLMIASLRHLLVAACCWLMPDRFSSPAFDQIRAILPLWAWGIVFAGAGVTCGVGAFAGRENLARDGLILSATSSALWGGGFLAAGLFDPNASPIGAVVWWAVAMKDLVVCRQPLRSPFESLVRQMVARDKANAGDDGR